MAEEKKEKKPETKETSKETAAKAPAAQTEGDEAATKGEAGAVIKKKKKSKKRSSPEAHVYIHASYNNTIVSVTETNGNVLCWSSSGACGFKGTRKATPYAASVATETALTKAKALGVERVHVSVKGIGSGRDQALRAVNASGLGIESIRDLTGVPHNGCRPRKARRV